MSSRSVAKLSRVTSSPARSASSRRSSASDFSGVSVTGVRAYSRTAFSPLSVSVVDGARAGLARLRARLEVAELGQALGLDVVLALAGPVEHAPAPRHAQEVVRAGAVAAHEAEDLVREQAQLSS